ncbi:MAG: pantoate--beta-alanine ligase [Phototrophicaceae bacterium]
MKRIDDLASLKTARKSWLGRIGFVPTMGALHDGHLELVRVARSMTDHVVVSIFVNPTQFNDPNDLAKYPRTLEQDLALLEPYQVETVFFPSSDWMYPSGFQTWVEVQDVPRLYEGGHRPGHFRGVTTVVAKLLNLVQADVMFLGQKDAQQVATLQRMVYDLNFSTRIQVVPTVREADGLAMSSRNRFLSAEERQHAPILYRSLMSASDLYRAGERDVQQLKQHALTLLQQAGVGIIEYLEGVSLPSFTPVQIADEQPILLVSTLQLGKIRLLDNLVLPNELNTLEGLTRAWTIG